MPDLSPQAVETELNCFFRPDYEHDGKTIINISEYYGPGMLPPRNVVMRDARELQRQEDDGSPDFNKNFLAKHGFLLLDHPSSVKNWDSGAFAPADSINIKERYELNNPNEPVENEIKSKYLDEVDEIIRSRIFPGARLKIEQAEQVLRRGKDTAHPFFGSVVHNDYGVTADHFESNTEAFSDADGAKYWRSTYDRDDVAGFMVLNFWRTVHMSEPLRHMPLGILDASSVKRDDLVISGLEGFTHSGRITTQLSLRMNENQRWYYYPEMTVDEVLVLNLFNSFKNTHDSAFHQCFHSAFTHPNTPANAEERQSCEHRVNVFVLD